MGLMEFIGGAPIIMVEVDGSDLIMFVMIPSEA
jgi:hypothetical protein